MDRTIGLTTGVIGLRVADSATVGMTGTTGTVARGAVTIAGTGLLGYAAGSTPKRRKRKKKKKR